MSNHDTTQTQLPAPNPTDFLAFSREFAQQVGLDPDISTWRNDEFQVFLDWWLLRTKGAASDS